MKIQLDTITKTLKLEESVNLGELAEMLEKFLPDGQWKSYKLETSIIHNWGSPIIIEKHKHFPRPYYPWWGTTIGGDTVTYDSTTKPRLKDGVYCLSVE